jgi:hypothetical protein
MFVSERAKAVSVEKVLPKWTYSTAFKLLFFTFEIRSSKCSNACIYCWHLRSAISRVIGLESRKVNNRLSLGK